MTHSVYSQKPLIELLKAGKFPGETTVPKHIETVISNVFIFENKVYKVYKNDNEFFNTNFRNLSGKSDRFSFTKRDFEWNRTLSPTIYTDLVGVIVVDNAVHVVEPDEKAEELMFVMNRVNTKDVLFEKLLAGQFSSEDSFSLGQQFGESMKKIQRPLQSYETAGKNYFQLFETRISDLRNWIKSVTQHISEEESGAYCDHLNDFRNQNRELFETTLTSEVTADGDFHSHNAIFSDGTLLLMDTFPPKEEWGAGHHHTPLYRIGADILALSGKPELFEHFVNGYEDATGRKVDRSLDDFYIIYASGIAVSYLYMLQETDPGKKEPAQRFHNFIRDRFSKAKKK